METLKAYYYTARECGFAAMPDGPFTLDNARIPRTTDPAQADVFVCPVMIHHMGQLTGRGLCNLANLYRLPYLAGNESRHVFFNCGDTFLTALPPESIIFRGDATKGLKRVNPNTYNLPWPAPNAYRPEYATGIEHDVSFIGWKSTELNGVACQSCVDAGLQCDIEQYSEFYGYIERDDPQRAKAMWDRYTQSINLAGYALCVRSIPEGVIRYRLFEAMSAGCVPVLIGDETLLPWPDLIDWDKYVLWIPERYAERTGDIIRNDAADRGTRHERREVWRNVLASDNWVRLCTDTVIRHMGGGSA